MAVMLHEMTHMKMQMTGRIFKNDEEAHLNDFGDEIHMAARRVIPIIDMTNDAIGALILTCLKYQKNKNYHKRPIKRIKYEIIHNQWQANPAINMAVAKSQMIA